VARPQCTCPLANVTCSAPLRGSPTPRLYQGVVQSQDTIWRDIWPQWIGSVVSGMSDLGIPLLRKILLPIRFSYFLRDRITKLNVPWFSLALIVNLIDNQGTEVTTGCGIVKSATQSLDITLLLPEGWLTLVLLLLIMVYRWQRCVTTSDAHTENNFDSQPKPIQEYG
jgi:hypothetical protein